MGAGIIIQARLTSSRFPNKVLCPLLGKPVIQWVIEAVKKTNIPFIVAIPENKTDQGIRSWLELYDKNIKCVLGHKEDLILRYKVAVAEGDFDPIIRITGDNPFVAPEDIKIALELFEKRGYYTFVNHVQVFSREELTYQDYNDPMIDSRQHAGCRGMAHLVDYPEDIKRYTKEWVEGSPTMNGKKRLWGIE